jgi:hypothetical protein
MLDVAETRFGGAGVLRAGNARAGGTVPWPRPHARTNFRGIVRTHALPRSTDLLPSSEAHAVPAASRPGGTGIF